MSFYKLKILLSREKKLIWLIKTNKSGMVATATAAEATITINKENYRIPSEELLEGYGRRKNMPKQSIFDIYFWKNTFIISSLSKS